MSGQRSESGRWPSSATSRSTSPTRSSEPRISGGPAAASAAQQARRADVPDRGIDDLDRVQGRQRATGPAKRRRHLDEAARVCARVDLGAGREHVRRLAVAELPGSVGLGDVVDPGAAAADVLLGGLDHREAGNPPQRDRRGERESLGVPEMARVLHRDREVERVAGRPGCRRPARNSPRSRTRGENAAARSAQAGSSPSTWPSSFRCEPQPEVFTITVSTPSNASIARAGESAPLLATARVHRESAAAALRRRHDLVAVGCEDPRRGRVDRPEHHGLDATCENADTPAGLATRGRNCVPASRSSARVGRSRSSRRGGPAAGACGRAAQGAAPGPSGAGRGGA